MDRICVCVHSLIVNEITQISSHCFIPQSIILIAALNSISIIRIGKMSLAGVISVFTGVGNIGHRIDISISEALKDGQFLQS